MANITITTTDVFLPEVWSPLVLETFHKNAVAAGISDRRYEKIAKVGDTIRVPDIDEITASTLTNMTGTVTFSATTEGATTNILINTLAYAAVKIDEAAVELNPLPIVELYTEEIGRAVAEKVDTDVFAGLDGTTNEKGSDNVPVDRDVMRQSLLVLDNNKVPNDERRFMTVSPSTFQDMRDEEKYSNSLYIQSFANAKGAGGPGYRGEIEGCKVYQSTNLPAGTNGKKNFMFHQTGIALWMPKEVRLQKRYPHDEIANVAVIAWALYGVKLMAAARVVEVAGT